MEESKINLKIIDKLMKNESPIASERNTLPIVGPDVGLILIIVFGSLTVLIAASILIYLILQRNGPRHRFFFRYDRGETAFILSDMEEVNTN